MSHFDVPLNLSHAATVANRIVARLTQKIANPEESLAVGEAVDLAETLSPFRLVDASPEEESKVVETALASARRLVGYIEIGRCGGDRVGQSVRNLFELLGEGKEGAVMGLRAGEDPDSLQRPT